MRLLQITSNRWSRLTLPKYKVCCSGKADYVEKRVPARSPSNREHHKGPLDFNPIREGRKVLLFLGQKLVFYDLDDDAFDLNSRKIDAALFCRVIECPDFGFKRN
jgi:hypothetical protein